MNEIIEKLVASAETKKYPDKLTLEEITACCIARSDKNIRLLKKRLQVAEKNNAQFREDLAYLLKKNKH